MSGMDNHRKRSRRSNDRKRATFGNMTRKTLIRQSPRRRRIRLPSLRDWFRMLRAKVSSDRAKQRESDRLEAAGTK
ncbi:MAG: hypothetical protein E7448_03850 [Ruminococcaceae bacterium]|nr:hypothetical protein [Oscillospiraceae bacterium]